MHKTPHLTFSLFDRFTNLSHSSFLRHTKEHIPPYEAFHSYILEKMGATQLVWAKQCHGTDIIDVMKDSPSGQSGDALITNQPGIALMVQHADCQPALFYDPVERVIAAVHSGWRGSVQNIYGKVIARLRDHYHCKPENLRVSIGPSLGPSNAEFIHYRTELPPDFWKYQITPNHFDFWAISQYQLIEAGILPAHIEIARICTFANPKDFFSYRRDKTKDRHGSVILMKK